MRNRTSVVERQHSRIALHWQRHKGHGQGHAQDSVFSAPCLPDPSSTSTHNAALFSAKGADCRVVQGPTRKYWKPVWNQAKVAESRHFMIPLHWVRHKGHGQGHAQDSVFSAPCLPDPPPTSTHNAALFSAKAADCRVVQGPTRKHWKPV